MVPERRYASITDYENFTGTRAPEKLDRRLIVAASRRIDRALKGARYDVDTNGFATDPDIRAAIRDATCAVVEDRVQAGDWTGTGQGPEWGSVAIGDVSLSRGAASASGASQGLPDKAFDVLDDVGLLPITPEVWG